MGEQATSAPGAVGGADEARFMGCEHGLSPTSAGNSRCQVDESIHVPCLPKHAGEVRICEF
jgi:hypothetical protein